MTIISFLTEKFERGLKYSTICGVLTAISKVTTIKKNAILHVFKRGADNLSPSVPNYQAIWDPNNLLEYLINIDITSPMEISRKTTSLFMVLFGQRVNTLSLMKITQMYLTETECTFTFDEVLKHLKQGYTQKPFVLRAFPHNKKLGNVQ